MPFLGDLCYKSPMKLNLKTDYALRVLIFLQSHEKARIKEISDHYNINKNHLSVVVNRLSELDLVHSSPGPNGGISLNPKSLNKNLAEIVTAFEDFDLVECFNPEKNTCNLNPNCKLKGILSKAMRSFMQELEKYTLRDIQQLNL